MSELIDYDDQGCAATDAYVLTGGHICQACGCYVPVHTVLAIGPFSDLGAGANLAADEWLARQPPTR